MPVLDNRSWIKLSLVGCMLFSLALYGFVLIYGNLNQDEGWYLYAAQRVHEGFWPYRDFFFTQGPVMPVIYGLLADVWSPSGVLGGRVLTLMFGLLGAVLTACIAARIAGKERGIAAAVLAFAFTACNMYHVYFTTLPKTYGLSFFLTMAGYAVLTLTLCQDSMNQRARISGTMVAGFLLALAAGTRLSMGMLLLTTGCSLLVTWRHTGLAFLWFGIGGALGLVCVFGPPLVYAFDNFVFAQTFHTARRGHDLMFIAGSLSRIVRFYMPLFALLGSIVVFCLFNRKNGSALHTRLQAWPFMWICGFLGVFALQLTSPYPYDDYQVPVMGLIAAAVAVWVVQILPDKHMGRATFAICLFIWMSAFGSPLLQEWMVIGQDRFWVIKKKTPDIKQLWLVAEKLRDLSQNTSLLLTQDVYLAVETGMHVPRGFEMGPFSYFPELSDADARRYHVLNKALLLENLQQTPASVAALSGYAFAIRSPIMDEVPRVDQACFEAAIAERYAGIEQIAHFGQNSTTLRLYVRRDNVKTHPPLRQ